MNIFKIENKKNLIFFIIGLIIILFLFIFLIITTQIGFGVKERCTIAQEKYGKNCIDSLIEFLDDEENSFRSRNSAIWALGQLGEARALPILEKYYTGNIPQKELLDQTISQYELKKAIKLLKGGFNMGAWGWRDSNLIK